MSLTEIDDTTYEIIRTQQVAWFLARDPLNDLGLARRQAQEMMDTTYVRRTATLQCESEMDQAEYIEEMSLGGRTYRGPR